MHNTAFVAGITEEVPEKDLIREFLYYGTVVAVNSVSAGNGKRLGYGFIQYENPNQAGAAVCGMHGTFMGTRNAMDLEVELNPEGIREQAGGIEGPRFGTDILNVIWND